MFKVGDKVWVRPWEEIEQITDYRTNDAGDDMYYLTTGDGCGFNRTMKKFCEEPAIVAETWTGTELRPSYRLKTVDGVRGWNFWTWRDWMLTDTDPNDDEADYDGDLCEGCTGCDITEDDDKDEEKDSVTVYFREAIKALPNGRAHKILDSGENWELEDYEWRKDCYCQTCGEITSMLEVRAAEDKKNAAAVQPAQPVAKVEEVKEDYVLFHNGEFCGFISLTAAEILAIRKVVDAIDTDTELMTMTEAAKEFTI